MRVHVLLFAWLSAACFASGYVHYEYDDAGAVILEQVLDPNDVVLQDVRREYDVLGKVFIERMVAFPGCPDNADDVITVYDYDVAGNLRKVIQKGIGSQDANSVPEAADAVTQYFYDALGRKSSSVDPEGIISDYHYSDAGQLVTVVDPYTEDPNLPFTTTNAYDAAGRLEETVNPEGHYTVNTYNSLNQIIKQVVWDCSYTPDNPADDVPVRQIRYEYDNLGHVTRHAVMEDPNSAAEINTAVDRVTDLIYDSSTGLLDETRTYYGTSATAAVTSYEYDDLGRLWRTTDAEGNQTTTYFDPSNNVQVAKEERLEHDPADSQNDYTVTVFYDYDLYGNLCRKTLDEDGDGVKDATDPSTYFYYDTLDRLTKQVGPDLVATYREFDSFGNFNLTVEDYDPESQTALNKTTEYLYDRLNRQAQVIAYDPGETTQITSYDYSKRGQIEKITWPDESFVVYSYNAQRKVNTEVRRDGSSIYYWYDLVGNVAVESDDEYLELGSPSFITEYEYNAAGDLVGTYREDDEVLTAESTFVYSGFGLAKSESTALYDFDAKTTSYTYDGSGNVLTHTHNGETFTYAHEGLGRVKTIDRGEDRIVDYYYIGSSTKVVDYPEADAQWEDYYDTLGRIDRCRSVGPDSETLLDLIYTYDENSNRDSVKYNHLAVPVWDIYTYDNLQRLIQADYGSPTGLASLDDYMGDVRFAAGVASKWLASDEPFMELAQLQVRDVRRQQRQVHSALIEAGLDTVVKEHNNGEMPVVTLVEFGEEEAAGQSTYEMIRNDSGELIGIVITDSNGRITLFTLYPAVGGTFIISISYDALGNETSKIFSSYDDDGNLVEWVDLLAIENTELAKAKTVSSSVASVNSVAAGTPTSLDGDGSFAMMSMPEGPETTTEEFLYDHLGNRYQVAKQGYTQTFTHDLNNQYEQVVFDYPLVPDETATFAYDDNGNLAEDWYGNQYSYDYRNRLTEVGAVAQYGYDALGRRVSKHDEDNNLTTYFYYDTFGRVIAEYEKPDGGDESLARSFVYGNGIGEVLAMFLPEKSFDPNDVLEVSAFCDEWLTSNATYDFDSSGVVDFNDFAVLADDGWSLPTTKETHFYYLKDALGSVVGIVGGKFERESDREFYLYDVYGKPSVSSVPSAAGNPYLFAGYRFDIEAGLYHTPYRTYDAETGRWLQQDPIGYADSMNPYEYVMSDPTNWVDPYGLKSLYKDQFSWWDRLRFEQGMVGGWAGLSHQQTARMDNYWLQYQRAQMLNQHPNEAKEYCNAAKSIASGCAKKAVMGYCHYIVYVDENGYRAVYDKILGYVADPYTNRILMCYEYNGQDIEQAIADACNLRMVGADLVGLTDMSYGVDYLQGKESIDTTTGQTFSGQEQYVKGLQGTSKFCGTVAACAQGVMACGNVIGAASAPEGVANPIQGLQRTGSAIKTDPYHAFPDVVDNFASGATMTQLQSGASLYQIEGSLNGTVGRFEWIVDKGNVTHRMFVPGGAMTGGPIKP